MENKCVVMRIHVHVGKFHGVFTSKERDIASFPGLHDQLLSLAVRKAGEGLDGLIM